MKLTKFRVQHFRSVADSGWIETSDVTALIGTNESGKTNLLMPLWKLNPAGEEGDIDLLVDAPRSRYNEIRDAERKPIFISAAFELSDAEAQEVATLASRPIEAVRNAIVERDLKGEFYVSFPNDNPIRTISREVLGDILKQAQQDLSATSTMKGDEALKVEILRTIELVRSGLPQTPSLGVEDINNALTILQGVSTENTPKTSAIVPRYRRLIEEWSQQREPLEAPGATQIAQTRQYVIGHLPKFVYYSNYGNLDSEIYLPHVIDNMRRTDLGAKEKAKARTLKVLFDFVRLSPEEIRELGRDFQDPQGREPSTDQIAEIARNKREREILMTSASSELTGKFQSWWKQGTYQFRFNADGDHFRIWVRDDKRHDEIELENRSTGLQWFLSFYLIFLVESKDGHAGAILLLDEPGLSLHPLAQRDLSAFFENLASTNQLLYTTHSPFLVDPDHLDRVKAVYIREDGTTGISSDLRAGEKDRQQTKSIYPVHAALGLSVSDILLVGAQPVIVEGTSDQLYLSAIKTLLISAGRIKPTRELIFIPAGGVKPIKAVAGILAGKDESLPMVLLDADGHGAKLAADLKSGLYADDKDRVLDVAAYCSIDRAEIEDLLPNDIMKALASRMLRAHDAEEDFSDVYSPEDPIVNQIEEYAESHHIALADGWKVDLAKQVKARLLRQGATILSNNLLDRWTHLFSKLTDEFSTETAIVESQQS